MNCWGIEAKDTELYFPCYVSVVILGVAVGFFSWSSILCLVLMPKIIVYVNEKEEHQLAPDVLIDARQALAGTE